MSSSSKQWTSGFYKLSRQERYHHLIEMGLISSQDLVLLNKEGSLDFHIADQLIENAIGCFPLPLGLALNFVIDGTPRVIPMAVEENSIIAGASRAAKWVAEKGELTTRSLGWLGIGQIQLPKVKEINWAKDQIELYKKHLIEKANQAVASRMVARGGGIQDLIFRAIKRPDGEWMAIIHVHVDTCHAMGANMINQICEYLKSPIEEILNEKVGMCIVSNLTDHKLVQAKVIIRHIHKELGIAIEEASLFARLDPYRAATHNKGALNGIDAVLIATGNDWRAVEAGVHAYASRTGTYTSITQWCMKEGELHGLIEIPLSVGIVGGAISAHPLSQMNLKILQVKTAVELARIVAAVGLVQNLAALHALVTQGISKGHMKLHMANLALAVGATPDEVPLLKSRLIDYLEKHQQATENEARRILEEIRNKKE